MAGTNRDLTGWRKSTYSGPNGGECLEVGGTGSNVLVRDTKNRSGAILDVKPTEWRRFIATVKATAW